VLHGQEEFKSSVTVFSIEGPACPEPTTPLLTTPAKIIGLYGTARTSDTAAGTGQSNQPPPEAGNFVKGHYFMDNDGDGSLTRFKDKKCHMQFNSPDGNIYKVTGKGDTEFGPFYVEGQYDVTTKEICVCRTYCDDDDATFISMPGPSKKARKKR